MPLTAGERIGTYEITAQLGAGGMGEVYRARDTKLGRDVALKVLSPALAGDAQYMARFQREAKVLASLNHPNIAAIYGLEDNALVMELVEGQTLNGPLPLETALGYARQITEALDYAHSRGVIHRDLKPANVKVTPDGVVKLLDFGLAKVAEETIAANDPDNSPTLTLGAATRIGAVMGTPAYMAPEQARGQAVDKRADIWSFGVVLYEILTGKRLFHGETVGDTMAEVLKKEIDLEAAPAEVRPLLRRCLERDRKQRLRDIGEAWRVAPENGPAPAIEQQTSRLPWAVAAVCLIAAIVAVGWGAWLRKSVEPVSRVALDVAPPEGTQFSDIGFGGGSEISPDGRTLVFAATSEKGETLLYIRPLDSLAARALPGTEEAGRPFWSPDGKSLAFVGERNVKRIDLAGGSPVSLCDACAAGRSGGAWNQEGVILFGSNAGLQRIPASGGKPELVTKVDREAGERFHAYPQFLPGGRRFLYLVSHSGEKTRIVFGSLDGKDGAASGFFVPASYKARYDAASGRLLYIQGTGTLMARRLALDPPALAGDPVTVADAVGLSNANGYADFSVSGNGSLFYRIGGGSKVRFGWRDRTGRLMETMGQPAEVLGSFSLSPDGTRVAYAAGPQLGQTDVWVVDLDRGASTRITSSGGFHPRWSPDGKQLYYAVANGISRKPADGSGEEELVEKEVASSRFVYGVSPDGKFLVFGVNDIMTSALMGDRKAEPYLKTEHSERRAALSPDGRWMAYESSESGRFEIYIQGFPDKRGKWVASAEGGQYAAWRADGKELYWLRPDNMLMAAGVELQASGVRVGKPEPLFPIPVTANFQHFQPSRDGKKFLVKEPEAGEQQSRMVVVQNWAAGLGAPE